MEKAKATKTKIPAKAAGKTQAKPPVPHPAKPKEEKEIKAAKAKTAKPVVAAAVKKPAIAKKAPVKLKAVKKAAAQPVQPPAGEHKAELKPAVHAKPAVAAAPASAVHEHAAVKPHHKPVEPAKHAAVPKHAVKHEPHVQAKPAAPEPAVKPPALEPAAKAAQPEVKPEAVAPEIKAAPAAALLKQLQLDFPISVKDLSVKLSEKPSVLIKKLMDMKVMAGINQSLQQQTVEKICQQYGYAIVQAPDQEELALAHHGGEDKPESLKLRPPIVTIMGHVDHGKTSILDAIRKSKVAESEHGGITQHIGAYVVPLKKGRITFLDTPGHEAFTAMRARGAKVTDIVVLVVAADDGVMPQTQEAIDHARAAGVCIVVALNKIDKPQAEPDRVKKQLSALGLTPEDWGGKTITVGVSAKTGEGIDNLLDMILLEAEMLELKGNAERQGKGIVLEAKLVKNKGPVTTLLVQNGTLRLNENILVGQFYGKIRAMFNDHGHPVTHAGPATPVEVLGITGVPEAGEPFYVIPDEKTAKELALQRQEKERLKQMQPVKRLGLEDLYAQFKEGKVKELNLVLKADAQGSAEAIKEALKKIPSSEIQVNIIHDGVGNINSSDVVLALASNALILGFNVNPDDQAKPLIDKEGQDVRVYNVIYELVNEVRAALEGMLAPKLKRVSLGRAEVRKVFKLSSSGTIAGCYVSKGKITRSAQVSLVRNGAPVFEGELSSLKRFKDDVREVEEGYECGIALKGFSEVMEGDTIEAFQIQKIARTL